MEDWKKLAEDIKEGIEFARNILDEAFGSIEEIQKENVFSKREIEERMKLREITYEAIIKPLIEKEIDLYITEE